MTSPAVPSMQPPPDLSLETGCTEPSKVLGSTGELLGHLALALEQEGIRYCQWKGHWSVHRWSRGYGDVDLLVDHAAQIGFRNIMVQLGFKLAHPAGERQIPGVEHYFGFDPMVRRLLHIHVHYRLLLGEYWNLVYRLPLEDQILKQSVRGIPFRVPSPTHTFLIFVFRMMLRQVGRPFLSFHARWLSGIQVPLASLEAASDAEELARLVKRLSPIDPRFFDRCVRSLQGRTGRVERFVLSWQLHLKLRSHVRRPSVRSIITAGVEKLLPPVISSRLAERRMCLAGGGLVLALIGGEGSGKSTYARELLSWLGPEFPTLRAHFGSPPKSLLTRVATAALEVQRSIDRWLRHSPQPGSYLALLQHLCTARDRFRLYQRVHRFAVCGGIAVCERYPIRQNYVHVAPCIPDLLPEKAGWLAGQFRRAEASYYQHMIGPDALFVLKLDPELAVLRKPGEPADYVRARNRVVWDTDWTTSPAHLVDAGRPLPEVLRELKTIIWSTL